MVKPSELDQLLPSTTPGELMGVAPTNRPVAFRLVHLVRFQDGKSIEHWAVRDDLTLMRQLGVVPSKGQ